MATNVGPKFGAAPSLIGEGAASWKEAGAHFGLNVGAASLPMTAHILIDRFVPTKAEKAVKQQGQAIASFMNDMKKAIPSKTAVNVAAVAGFLSLAAGILLRGLKK